MNINLANTFEKSGFIFEYSTKFSKCKEEAPFLIWNLLEVLSILSIFYPVTLITAISGNSSEFTDSLSEVK